MYTNCSTTIWKVHCKLRGKVVWITGASSGIGESLAYELAANGVKLAISGTNESRLQEVKKKCILMNNLKEDDILVLSFNVTDLNEHQKQFNSLISHFKTGYFESVRSEIRSKGISVTMLCPGPVVSRIVDNVLTENKGVKYEPKDNSFVKQMETSRCAYLSGIAIANQLDEFDDHFSSITF
ncbi:unnamed protein product [Medioppia subpectinata]|uniref:Uncharacterized protein n=1 Tax=Medioppia subpectinata TaxID=1979941 RepID=A0A7R9KTV2_9ACAR|nr:unnamed protein product [Medioppia subpectinata]CAG2109399.1 unnamed protein product [Medioppia subpectinata]